MFYSFEKKVNKKDHLIFDEVVAVGYDFHPTIEDETDIFIALLLPKGIRAFLKK